MASLQSSAHMHTANEIERKTSLSSLPHEIKEMVCTSLPQYDLLNLTRTAKSWYHAASPRLYKIGHFMVRIRQVFEDDQKGPKHDVPRCQSTILLVFPSWAHIQNITLDIDMSCPGPRRDPYELYTPHQNLTYDQLSPVRNVGWSYPMRNSCRIIMKDGTCGCVCDEYEYETTLQALMGLIGFRKVYLEHRGDRDYLLYFATILEPALGPSIFFHNGKTDPVQRRTWVEFYPAMYDTEGFAAPGYEAQMLEEWGRIWGKTLGEYTKGWICDFNDGYDDYDYGQDPIPYHKRLGYSWWFLA